MKQILKKVNKFIFMGALSLGMLGGSGISFAAKDRASFDSIQLINRTASHVQSCTDYCIVGMELRMYMTWRGPRFFRTLVVEHNMPDLLVMTANREEEMPWDIYRNTFSKLITDAANSVLKGTTGIMEFGGGHSQSTNFGQTQAVTFKETDVVGNPSLFMYELLGSRIPNSGAFDPRYQTGGISSQPNLPNYQKGQLDNLIAGMTNGVFNMPLSVIQAMGGAAIRSYAKVQPQALLWRTVTRQFVHTFGGGARVNRYTCNGVSEPMLPYYTSLFDFAMWRGGFPITDPHKATTILNPLGDDWLRPQGMQDVSNSLGAQVPYGWGRIYPRTGFVNHADDYKVGTVTAVRGVSVASDNTVGRIRKHAGGALGKVMWQQVHPSTSQCHYNVTNTINGADNNVKKNYAWNAWRRTKCSLHNRGSKVMDIPFPTICMRNVFGGGVNQ